MSEAKSGAHHHTRESGPAYRFAHAGYDSAPSQPADVLELLHALALHLGAVDVALRVDADEVQVVELAELVADAAPGADKLTGRAVDGVELAVRVIDHKQIALLRVRPHHDRADRAGIALLQYEEFPHEGAVLAKHLHAIVLAVADQHEAILRNGDAVDLVGEMRRRRRIGPLVPGCLLLVARRFTVGAPMALVSAGRRVE